MKLLGKAFSISIVMFAICLVTLPVLSNPILETKVVDQRIDVNNGNNFDNNFKKLYVSGIGDVQLSKFGSLSIVTWKTFDGNPIYKPNIKITRIIGTVEIDQNRPTIGTAFGFLTVNKNAGRITIDGFAFVITGIYTD